MREVIGQWADTARTPTNKPTEVIRRKSKAGQSWRPKQRASKHNEVMWQD